MSGELRAVSRAALRPERPKALSRKTKAVALAKAVGTVAGVGTLAVGVGALAHMLYSTPPEELEGEQMSARPRNAEEFLKAQTRFSGEAARHIANLAVATGIAPSVLLQETDRMLNTMLFAIKYQRGE